MLHHTEDWKFPASTLTVNVLGFLGGFTTFSAFGLETMYLLQRHEIVMAVANVMMNVIVGILALWLGLKVIPTSGIG